MTDTPVTRMGDRRKGEGVKRNFLRGLLALGLCAAAPAWANTGLVLSTSVGAPYTTADRQGFLDQLVAAVFKEIGVSAQVLVYPGASERSLLNANAGIDDGQVLRVAGLSQQYPNLIQVPESIIMNDFVAMSTKHRFAIQGWASLQPYTVTYIIGWKVFENNVPAGTAVTPVREPGQMFTLLERDRADVALYERWQGLEQARTSGVPVRVLEPALLSTPMYMYLHKKHEALVPRVAEALARMKQNGAYQRIHERTLRP
jgi:polar amino acid transport system substrate-binding protein